MVSTLKALVLSAHIQQHAYSTFIASGVFRASYWLVISHFSRCGPGGAASVLDALIALSKSVMDDQGFSVGLADVTFTDSLNADAKSELADEFLRETRGAAPLAMALRGKGGVQGSSRSEGKEDTCPLERMLGSDSHVKAVQTLFKVRKFAFFEWSLEESTLRL
jgi:hypothetical protein